MVIHLEAATKAESFRYRFVMEGTEEAGYRVHQFERSALPFIMPKLARALPSATETDKSLGSPDPVISPLVPAKR
jgi:hypothetical protein